jgi:hypothetical protein
MIISWPDYLYPILLHPHYFETHSRHNIILLYILYAFSKNESFKYHSNITKLILNNIKNLGFKFFLLSYPLKYLTQNSK